MAGVGTQNGTSDIAYKMALYHFRKPTVVGNLRFPYDPSLSLDETKWHYYIPFHISNADPKG
jgi:hypothetical protein